MNRSTKGRPRKATQAQVDIILAWQRNKQTLRQLAQSLNLPKSTVAEVLRRRGIYKQPPPEERGDALEARRQHIAMLSQAGWL